jgi:hypothetical protein
MPGQPPVFRHPAVLLHVFASDRHHFFLPEFQLFPKASTQHNDYHIHTKTQILNFNYSFLYILGLFIV